MILIDDFAQRTSGLSGERWRSYEQIIRYISDEPKVQTFELPERPDIQFRIWIEFLSGFSKSFGFMDLLWLIIIFNLS